MRHSTFQPFPFLICLFLMTVGGKAQCPTGDLIINSQEDLESFISNYPDCTQIMGDLTIDQPDGEEYTSLDFLSNIVSIEDGLNIRGNAEYFSAFSNLQSIGGILRIEDIAGGGEVEIPNSITYLGSYLRIANCQNMSVSGMEGLQSMTDALVISSCSNLEFNALQNIIVMDRISIGGCDQVDLSGGLQSLETLTVDDFSVYSGVYVANMGNGGTLALPNSITSINSVRVLGCNDFTITGLEGVTYINGRISIENCSELEFNALPSLEILERLWITNCFGNIELFGLENLQVIEHSFRIQDCPSTTLIVSGFNCESFINEINIDSNEGMIGLWWSELPEEVGDVFVTESNITSLDMFSDIEQIHGSLKVNGVPELGGVSGLSSLTSIGSDFWLIDAPVLNSTDGLASIQEIGGSFRFIEVGQELDDLAFSGDGFTSLISIGGNVEITDMPFFGNWKTIGFPQLEHVGGGFYMNNVGLESIELMTELSYVGGDMSISECPDLWYCEIPFICNSLFGVYLSANGANCTCVSCIECPDFPQVSGNVFADINCDEYQGAEDIGIPVHKIFSDGNLLGFTNSEGEYSIDLAINEDHELSVAPLMGYQNDTSYTISSPTESESFYYDFPMCSLSPENNYSDLSVSITPINDPRPGFINHYELCVYNLGNVDVSGDLTLEIDPSSIISISDSGIGSIEGNVILWQLETLSVFESICHEVSIQIDSTALLGTALISVANIEIEDGQVDQALHNNSQTIQQTVVGSYDPNDKLVDRELIDVSNYENNSLFTLEYLIRFQNTGTAAATFVKVKDFLPPELDPLSIEMIHASHDYELSFTPEQTGFVELPPRFEWFFDNINLPDSTTNEPESHGYIHFRISTYPDIEAGDIIENYASIFFDYNLPIITEEAITEFVDCDEESMAIDAALEVCAGDTVLLTAALPDFDSYTWTVEGNEFSGGQQVEAAFFSSGDLALTITNETCTLSSSLEIEVKAQPELNLQPEPYVSCDSEIEMDITANGQVSWFYGDSLLASGNTTTLTQSGIYNITNENECGMIEGELEVVLHQLNLEEPELLCAYDPVALEPNFDGYDSFSWIVEGEQYTGDSISVAFSGDGSVELQVSSAFCADSTFLNFEVLPQPSMNIVLEPYVGCFGEVQIDLDAVGLVNWWLDGGIVNIGDPVTLQESGSYNVTVANDCNTIENEVNVEVYDIPEEVTLTFSEGQLVVEPEGTGYQWLLDGFPINGEDSVITPTENGEYTVIVYFENSMCNQSSTIVLTTVSLKEQLAQQIIIHPNPTRDFATIQLPQGEWTISLLNPKGQVLQMHEKVTSTQFQLDLQELSPGVYFVRVNSGSGMAVKKLVVH